MQVHILNIDMDNEFIITLQFLISRLERISADSVVAHRASGIRGAILRALEQSETGNFPSEKHVKYLIDMGYSLLQKAAGEIGR
ncbi:hypothetical protein ADM99_07560 [Leptolinea tardivitalis]|uniref:Uncharacterized protein n=2 Tax=Leptolinea tardivitalis TaxID=229920 RepID=A0A0P6X102_9CHLR|nr:hypothetical protein ADM99_07560 [Leptolinea tardivitalis]GAP20721.1 hypothetical protein LTAR_00916 [Leptolinea tardivitalis]